MKSHKQMTDSKHFLEKTFFFLLIFKCEENFPLDGTWLVQFSPVVLLFVLATSGGLSRALGPASFRTPQALAQEIP